MIVTIASTKGGVGKSTLVANLAVGLAELGKSVFLIDGDTQGTLSSWAQIRVNEGLPEIANISASNSTLAKMAVERSKAGEVVLIDTIGAKNKEIEQPLLCADVVLTISAPTPADLWELDRLENVVKRYGNQRGKKLPWYLILNRVHPSTKDLQFVEKYLVESDIYPTGIFENVIRQRTAYSDSLGQGRGATETADTKAGAEVLELTKELLTIL